MGLVCIVFTDWKPPGNICAHKIQTYCMCNEKLGHPQAMRPETDCMESKIHDVKVLPCKHQNTWPLCMWLYHWFRISAILLNLCTFNNVIQCVQLCFKFNLTASEAVGTLSLVYFAGHGFTDGNKEYLMPVDAMEANYKTNLSREDFCAKLRERPKLGKLIRISDCCRTFK